MRRFLAALLPIFFALIVSVSQGSEAHAQRGGEKPLPARAQRLTPQARAWLGEYQYTELGGRTVGGSAIVITHNIHVYEEGGSLFADINATGFQTNRAMRCDVRVAGTRLNLYLNAYEEGNVFESYRPGELLLTLERRRRGNRTIILTYWRAMRPAAIQRVRNGRIYFTHSRA